MRILVAGLTLAMAAGSVLVMAAEPASVPMENPGGYKYFIGIVGNPSSPDISWSDDELTKIKALGVNMVQLSIAWGGKPANEVLNLEDLDAEQRAKFAFRITQAKKHGLRTIAHFGVPRMLNFSPVRPACIMDPAVREKYVDLLSDFMTSFPEVDDVLIYTYDQQAWICSEFGPCPRCSGLPLHERLPGFINLLNETMQKHRPHTTLWWKPWELSKGQTVAILDKVNPDHFGLVLNPSSSNEVYPFNDRSFKSDLGVKRLVRMALERNIPVIGEFDHTLYKPLYLIEDYFPRLVYEQMRGWKEMEGVIGIKEYYGFSPVTFSVNADMLKAWIKSPDAPLDQLLQEVAAPYGEKAAPTMIQAWEYVAQSVEAYPWDTTYLIGPMGLDRHRDGSHSWEPVSIIGTTWQTPIWQANRRANFMLTQEHKAHPWLFEDAGLRLEDSAALAYKAVELFDKAAAWRGAGWTISRCSESPSGKWRVRCGASHFTSSRRWRHRMRGWSSMIRSNSLWWSSDWKAIGQGCGEPGPRRRCRAEAGGIPQGPESLADRQPQSPGLRIDLHPRLDQVDNAPAVVCSISRFSSLSRGGRGDKECETSSREIALPCQLPVLLAYGQTRKALVLIVDLVHLVDGVKVTDDERAAERLAGFDGAPAKLLDHAHITALVAPCFVHNRRIERHTGQPRAGLATLGVAEPVRTNEARGWLIGLVAAIVEPCVRRKVLQELRLDGIVVASSSG